MGRPVTQWQILSKNPDRLGAFYAKLFDWKVDRDNALGYRAIDTGSKRGIGGGIWPSPPEGASFVQLFVDVDDLPRYVKEVTSLGRSVLIPPQKLPDGDEMAIVRDPDGISFGLIRTR